MGSDHAHELLTTNSRLAKKIWKGKVARQQLCSLDEITERFELSVRAGDLLLLQGKWYITNSGLMRVAAKNRCSGITVEILDKFSNPASQKWVFRATVYKQRSVNGFVG